MKMRKTLLTLVLALVATAIILNTPTAKAATVSSGTCGDNLTWTLDDAGTLTISGTGAMKDYDYFYEGAKPQWHTRRASIKKVIIDDGVTTIGAFAFCECSSITSVTVGSNVTTIGFGAFNDCYSLTSITIPDSVTAIDSIAFSDCNSLDYNIYDNAKYLGNSNNPYFILICTINKNVTTCQIHPDTKIIYYEAFRNCSDLASISVPDSVTSIGADVFADCTSLSYNVYDNAKYLGNSNNPYVVLMRAVNFDITSCQISPGAKVIYDNAFAYCSNLNFVIIPGSVNQIGKSAFYLCSALNFIAIPDSVTSIGSSAFCYCTSLHGVTIGSSVTSIAGYAFYECTSLTSVTIPDGVTSIGDDAFHYCDRLTSVTIPDSVTYVGYFAFESSPLRNVYYTGTQTQWNSITICPNNDRLAGVSIHYNHIHDYTVLPAVTVEPTCTEPGYTEYTCISGEKYKVYEKAALGHDFSGSVITVAPTCTKQGYTANSCTRCSEIETVSTTDATGHKMIVVPATEPTCTQPGMSVGTVCEYCGMVGAAQTVTQNKLDHSYIDHVGKRPTCTESGWGDYQTCANCDYTSYTELSATGHNYVEQADKSSVCSGCGDTIAAPVGEKPPVEESKPVEEDPSKETEPGETTSKETEPEKKQPEKDDTDKQEEESSSTLWIVLVVVVVLAAGGTATFLILKKRKTK